MEVAISFCQEEWDEWRKKLKANRRVKWTERMKRWAVKVEVKEVEGDESVGEEDKDSEEDEAGRRRKEEEVMEEGSEQEDRGETKVRGEAKATEEEKGEMKEAQDTEEEEEEGENESNQEVKVDDEEKEVMESEMFAIGVEEEIRMNEEMFEREREVKEVERCQEEGEMEVEVKEEEEEEKERKVNEEDREEQVEEEDEQPVQEQSEHDHESTAQEDETIQEEDNLSDSIKFDEDDSGWMRSEEERYNSEGIKNEEVTIEKDCRVPEEWEYPDENNIPRASKERQQEDEKSWSLTDEEEILTESCTTQEEEFQDEQENFREEEDEEDSTDEEEAEHSMYEDAENDNEDIKKIYCKDGHPTDMFQTLREFRDSSLLTDLNLVTDDGKSFQVHSPVLAAVSSLILERLCRRNKQTYRVDKRNDDDRISGWSVSLGPDVDHVGLEAVVEFAYCGLISCLNKDNVEQIKIAAQTLGVPRVLDLCTEEKSTKNRGQMKEQRISAAEQMAISLQSVKQLWMDRVGCDIILETVGESFQVHRVILAASSDYFRGMFTLGMRESHQSCVMLPFLLASELEVLVSCSYSGALPLTWSCVFEITSTALQLQYEPALSLCLNFLQQEINPESCLDVVSFAKAYEMAQLLEVAHDFVLRQFQKVSCTLKFKDLPAKQLLMYLNSHSLYVPSELVVFKAVVAWIQARPKIRLKLAKELMKTIHFPLMTFKEFKEVQSLNMWCDDSLVELYEAIFEDFCSNNTAPLSQCRIYLPKESLVLVGGDQISEDLGSRSISRELWFGNSLRNHTGIKKAMEWRRLGEMPEPARFSHEVAVLKGQLYVFGGKKYYGIGDTLNCVYRYDPCQNTWEKLAEMQQKRCSFSVVVLDGKLYAIGGHCDPDYIDSVERYGPTGNSWSFTCPLDLPLSGHVAKVLQGQIFVSGGRNTDYSCLASLFLYHPETGSTYLANMNKPRAHHCMEILGDCLYVAGGVTANENIDIVDQLACEVYNPVAESWTAFTSLPVPHVGAGSAVLEGKFYLLGGYSLEDYSDTKMVHRYDPATQRWENMGKMPGPNNDIRASVLCLPPHIRS